jgi:hypothetical protein
MNKSDNKIHCQNIPILDGENYTAWSSQMKIFLRGKKLFHVCNNGWDKNAPQDVKTNYLESNDEAISFIVSRMNERCFNEVVDTSTIDSAHLLWTKIIQQYASHSIVNRGCVFMKWSSLTYDGDMQTFINNMRSALCDIKSVEIVIPPTIISYVIIGKLMKIKELDQIVDKIALSEDSVETPYLVLDALQTYYTPNLNKVLDIKKEPVATALVSSLSTSEFPSTCAAMENKILKPPLTPNHVALRNIRTSRTRPKLQIMPVPDSLKLAP